MYKKLNYKIIGIIVTKNKVLPSKVVSSAYLLMNNRDAQLH
jgi:hypothetical protein